VLHGGDEVEVVERHLAKGEASGFEDRLHGLGGAAYMCDSLSSSKITHFPVASGPTSMAIGLEYFLSAR
jgi:hypothetical protein